MFAVSMNKLLSLITGILSSLSLLLSFQDIPATTCLEYQQAERTIEIRCGTASVSDLYNSFGPLIIKNESPKVWVLNANIRVRDDATFYINTTDTLWLKINSTATDAYSITSQGNLRIDSVKLTSWDTLTNNYTKISNDSTEPRGYIRHEKGTGTLDITNSELGYLGYNGSKSSGLSYYSGSGSIIYGNRIHDLWNGFYSASVENITIENNQFYNNIIYGIDPHSGAHDLIIRQNRVYNNGWHGIICSKHCYNIMIDSNRVSGNAQTGIILHGNTTNSALINNTVHDNKQDQISLQNSADNNSIYNNKLSGGNSGIEVAESSNNNIYNNTIKNAYYNILIHNGSSGNLFESNDIIDAHNYTLYSRDANTSGNIFVKNNISAAIIKMLLINNTSMFINNTVGNMDTKYEFTLLNDSALVLRDNTMRVTEGVIKSDSGYEPLPLSARLQSKKSALDTYLGNQSLN
jgi:mannuronan 5-epimerase